MLHSSFQAFCTQRHAYLTQLHLDPIQRQTPCLRCLYLLCICFHFSKVDWKQLAQLWVLQNVDQFKQPSAFLLWSFGKAFVTVCRIMRFDELLCESVCSVAYVCCCYCMFFCCGWDAEGGMIPGNLGHWNENKWFQRRLKDPAFTHVRSEFLILS